MILRDGGRPSTSSQSQASNTKKRKKKKKKVWELQYWELIVIHYKEEKK